MCGGRWKLKIPFKNNLFSSVFCVHLFIYRVAYKFERTVLPRPFFSFSVLDQPASFRVVLFCIFFVSFIMFRCQGFDAATGRCTVKVKSCNVNICELYLCVRVRSIWEIALSGRDCDYAQICSCCWWFSYEFRFVRCQIAWMLTVVSKSISFAWKWLHVGPVSVHECEFLHACMGGVPEQWESNKCWARFSWYPTITNSISHLVLDLDLVHSCPSSFRFSFV